MELGAAEACPLASKRIHFLKFRSLLMTPRHSIPVLLIGLFSLQGVNGVFCQEADLAFVNTEVLGENFLLGFVPNGNEWISLEASSDLSNWRNIASVATTNAASIIHDPITPAIPHRFYRLRHPGFSVDDAEERWTATNGGDYRFNMRHLLPSGRAFVVTGTLTVEGGLKTITNAQEDGEPVETPRPEDFPVVPELFASLREAQSSGCWRVAAMYDPEHSYPLWCVIERVSGGIGKQIEEYWITDFELIDP